MLAIVDFPAPDRPVSHSTHGRCPFSAAWAALSTQVACRRTFCERRSPRPAVATLTRREADAWRTAWRDLDDAFCAAYEHRSAIECGHTSEVPGARSATIWPTTSAARQRADTGSESRAPQTATRSH